MPPTIKHLDIAGVILIAPKKHADPRGYFSETYNRRDLATAGIVFDFIQDNHALSAAKGTVRGLHFQVPPFAQTKLVRVARGAVIDVAVDLRAGSPTFGRHVAVELSALNWHQLLVPAGFAHGYCTLEPDTEVLYKVDADYAPQADKGLLWNDPDLAIAWPDFAGAEVSGKDKAQPRLRDIDSPFRFSASGA